MVAVDRLAKYFTIQEAAGILDVPESRFRASWRQNGIVRPALTKGLQQITRADLLRGAVLLCLQGIFGEASPLALDLARSLTEEQLDVVLYGDDPLTARAKGYGFRIHLDPEYLERVREGISTVRV
jgi:hypothetical protein